MERQGALPVRVPATGGKDRQRCQSLLEVRETGVSADRGISLFQ